ncbi:MAG: response regulator [Bdellovibrionota bacterium]|nr:MAG: response regulator [Bdellovibrionota bacterium]
MVNEDILAQALGTLKTPLAIFDRSGTCRFANKAFEDFLVCGDKKSAIPLLSQILPTLDPDSAEMAESSHELKLGNGQSLVVRLACKRFGDGYVLLRIVSRASQHERLDNFHAQRLETLGLLAGGIAHDFNNVLAGILGHISYLKTILPAQGPHIESLRTIEDGSKKASQMTQQILKFSKMESGEVGPVDLNDLVQRTVSLLRRAISPEYNIETQLCTQKLTVLAAEAKLAQILANLMINARDALPTNGTIRVEVVRVTDPAELDQAFVAHERGAASYARLTVTDNGHGMSQEVRERIFEPYFSTKSDQGTGLGLTTVLSIVRELGGAISVHSEQNKGTRIAVYLPDAEGAETIKGEAAVLDSGVIVGGREECVLVVDDEYPVRNVIALGLTHLGYKVISASSGIEGIELYRANSGKVALVLLDMLMPSLSGHDVYFKLRGLDPKARVLLMSGYSSEELVDDVLRNGGMGFLQKPFSIEELSRQVRRCIDDSPDRNLAKS